MIACECAEKCVRAGEIDWPTAAVFIVLIVAGAFVVWALFKYT